VYEGYEKFSWSFGGTGYEETWKNVENVEMDPDIKKVQEIFK